jgi:hypothetical protein
MRLGRSGRLALLLAVVGSIAWGLVRASAPESDRQQAHLAALGFAAQQLVDADHTLCISIDDGGALRDPSDGFMKQVRFSGTTVAGSRCRITDGQAQVAASGARAVVLAAGEIHRVSDAEVWVDVRHFRTSRFSGIRTYRLVREADAWVALGQILRDGPV